MPKPTMTSRERVLRAINHQPTDVLPTGPFIFDLAAAATGIQVNEFATSGEVMAQAQLALHQELGQDIIFLGCDNYYIAQGFGCQVEFPDDEIPHLHVPACESIADIYALKVPNPLTDGRMPVMLEATRRVRAAVGDAVAIRTPGTGPFSLASYFIGTQQFLLEVGLAAAGLPEGNPQAIHHALDLATEALIAFGKACVDAGSDILHCGDSLSSCDMISPAVYQEYAYPYQKRVIQAWKAYGGKALLHVCGSATKVLDLYLDTGADLIEIDHKVNLAHAKERVGKDTCLIGNLDTVQTLLLGTTEDVERASEDAIAAAARGGGYILSSGCMIPRLTPVENVQAMINAAHAHPNDTWV